MYYSERNKGKGSIEQSGALLWKYLLKKIGNWK